MEVRDAAERDTEAIAGLTGIPHDVLINIIHDRTAFVGERDDSIVGFVSFDADIDTVYITQLAGESPTDCERLVEEPIRFAQQENMTVEVLVLETEPMIRDVITASEFSEHGEGPRFDSIPSTRYRFEP